MGELKTVFIVDDNNVNLLAAEEALTEHYNVFTLPSAAGMFELLKDIKPDMILLDIGMPEMNGFEALHILKSDEKYKNIPVIFLTGFDDSEWEVRGFEAGAIDFIMKPFSELVLLNRIKTHLHIDEMIIDKTKELRTLKNGIVSVLSRVVENRDSLTGGHIERTSEYIQMLLEALSKHAAYTEEISKWDFELVGVSASLHDVGKITVPDSILNKQGKLTDDEFEEVKKHAAEGEKIINEIIAESGNQIFLNNAKMFAGFHHERWDGSGYPCGLKGEDIPLQGRIMAIVDVYDALVSERPYKPAFSHEKAVSIIEENKGKHFDPDIVDVFLEISDSFAKAAN